MSLDEVYQAALEAGSGGIRWNNVTNFIQIRSTEGSDNWIDWKYYNPEFEVTHDLATTIDTKSVPSNLSLTKRGLYCVSTAGYNGNTFQISTSAQILNSYSFVNNTIRFMEYILYSTGEGENVSIHGSISYGSANTVIYIGPYSNISNPQQNTYVNNTSVYYEQEINAPNSFVHFFIVGNNRYPRTFNTTNIDNKYISVWDPGEKNTFSGACINHGGSVYVRGLPGGTSSVDGGVLSSVYTLVE